MNISIENMDRIQELIEEIKGICIGADSPDAIKNGKEKPEDELRKCREDLSLISDIVEEIEKLTEEE